MPEQRKFAVFLDYRNLEQSLQERGDNDYLKDFFWLEEEIIRRGKIVASFVFIQENYAFRAPVRQLSDIYQYNPILCLREMVKGGTTTKEKDSVDTKMINLAKGYIEIDGITDIVIVSGDADFSELAVHARRHQKNVTIISASEALSGRFIELNNRRFIDLVVI